jgi:uncharacterized protein (TIGR00645 family)
MKKIERLFEAIVFASRWLQAIIYAGLIVGSGFYTYKFVMELIHLCMTVNVVTESQFMLGVLTLVDIAMVANLLVMVIIGGYSTFVGKMDIGNEDKLGWLSKVSAGTLKIKLAASLVGVSGIHLLQTFINIGNKSPETIKWQVVIHLVFLASTIGLALTEKIYSTTKEKV